MNPSSINTARNFLLLVGALAVAACQEPPGHQPETIEYIKSDPVLPVSGVAFDPEAIEFSFQMCGGFTCPDWAVGMPGFLHFDRGMITGAQVSLFDPTIAAPAYPAAEPSARAGVWVVNGVPRREIPLFSVASKDDGGGQDGFGLPKANTYFPTFSLRPIVPLAWQCVAQEAPLVSDVGILQAVAHHLTARGEATVPADFIDPVRFGGVVIWRNLMPHLGNWAGAPGTTTEASAGEVINVHWAPPGSPMPPGVTQSERGYFVAPQDPVSNVGLTVTLFDPLLPGTPPPEVTFHGVDPVEDAQLERPWTYQELPPVPVAPGVIYFGQLLVAPEPWIYPYHPEPYLCLPPEH